MELENDIVEDGELDGERVFDIEAVKVREAVLEMVGVFVGDLETLTVRVGASQHTLTCALKPTAVLIWLLTTNVSW